MASTIDPNKKNVTQTDAANTQAAQATPAAAADAPAGTSYTGLAGLSDNTKQNIGRLSAGYTPSESVNAAQQYLNNVVNGKPGDYQSQYKGQLESLYNQVMNRDPFTFDLNGDILYNQYKDQYTQQGKQAMMDTMGQAAAMTGGYGNSYAQTAGQQAYQSYLTQLNNIVPELYQQAYNRYTQEGTDLQNQLSLTQGLEDNAYAKYRDTVSDWNNERNFANEDYWNRYNADYSSYVNDLNYWNTVGQQENTQYNTDRQMAYTQAMSILQTGKMPSSDLLAMAGISEADAKLLRDANKKSSGGGSSKKSSSGSYTPQPTEKALTYNDLGSTAKAIMQVTNPNQYSSSKASADTVKQAVKSTLERGKITQAEADYILKKHNL